MEEESSKTDFIKEFEECLFKIVSEKNKFASLTEIEIAHKIDKVKKNCCILHLKNEIFEKYLKRHNFGALRDVYRLLEEEKDGISVMDRIFEKEYDATVLKSKELLEYTTKDSTEQENIGFLIKVVEQEISEICLKSKSQKKFYDKKVVAITSELECYNTQNETLDKLYSSMCELLPANLKLYLNCEELPNALKTETKDEQIPNNLKMKMKDKTFDFMKYFEKCIRNVNIEIRKASLLSFDIQQKYVKFYRTEYLHEGPILPVDVKLLEIENEKLKKDLDEDNQVYLDLRYLLDNYQMKFDNVQKNYLKLTEKKVKIEDDIKKMEKRLTSLENYYSKLLNEVKLLETEKKLVDDLTVVK